MFGGLAVDASLRPGACGVLDLVFRAGRVAVDARLIPLVELRSPRGVVWAPFTLSTGAPLPGNASESLLLQPGARQGLALDLLGLRWEQTVAARWPSRSLREAAPHGTYEVVLHLEDAAARGTNFPSRMSVPCGMLVIPAASDQALPADEASLQRLAAEYRRLREEVRRGSTDPELRRWGGAMHDALARIGELLGDGGHSAQSAIALLGPPDRTVAAGEHTAGGTPEAGQTRLVYAWRGMHDYLSFDVERGAILRARWYFAGE